MSGEAETAGRAAGADERLVIGCMTGTSLDAIDVAVVRLIGRGLAVRAEVLAWGEFGLDEIGAAEGGAGPSGAGLAARLRAMAGQRPMAAGEIARLARGFGLAHAGAVRAVLAEAAIDPAACDLVCAHGQTVWHRPPTSWQLLDAAVLAERLGVPVVSDLRAADLAAGGQGAPITPIADVVLFGHAAERRVVVNLGGFVNLTRLPAGLAGAMADSAEPGAASGEERGGGLGGVTGGDVCAGNHVLDAIARLGWGEPFDRDGQRAVAGAASAAVVAAFDAELAGQFELARDRGCSFGTGAELVGLVERLLGEGLEPETLARSACEALAGVVARAAVGEAIDNAADRGSGEGGRVDRVLLAGGGVRNRCLTGAIERAVRAASPGTRVETTAAAGVDPSAREAVGMAVLGGLCQDGVPITLPRITGGREPAPVAGVWTGLSRRV